LPGTVNLSSGTVSDAVVSALDNEGVCVSGGVACSSGKAEPSYALTAIGRDRNQGLSAIRFLLERKNTKQDLVSVVKILKKVMDSIRNQAC